MHKGLRLAAKTPVYDHADAVLFFACRSKAIDMMQRHDVEVIHTRHRIRGLRMVGPDPAHLPGGNTRRANMGHPHRHSNYWNARGVWHFDHIPLRLRWVFQAAILECMSA